MYPMFMSSSLTYLMIKLLVLGLAVVLWVIMTDAPAV